MAAAYLYRLCQNRPFIDGKKRVSANAAMTFLLMNNWGPTFGEDESVELVRAVASGRVVKSDLIAIFEAKCRALHGEWPRSNRSPSGPTTFDSSPSPPGRR